MQFAAMRRKSRRLTRGMKICSTCGIPKEESEFYLHGRSRPGLLRRNCKKCCYLASDREANNARQKKYAALNREKVNAKQLARHRNNPQRTAEIARLSKYGVTPERYMQLREEQKDSCAVCKLPKKLCVDHNHSSGQVRGLLCQTCNRALGMIKDSVSIAEALVEYLKKHS